MKTCTSCGEVKGESSFYRNRSRKDGRGLYCKSCVKIKSAPKGDYQSDTKKCSMCGEVKPLAMFTISNSSPSGRFTYCMVCSKIRSRQWRENNRERMLQYKRQIRKTNAVAIKEYNDKWRSEHQDYFIQWRQDNRDRNNLIAKQWAENNPELVRAKGHRYRTKKAGNGGSYTPMEWFDLCETYNWQCLCCGKHSYESPLTVDHIIPVTKGGSSNIGDLQPLCDHCNKAKGTKTTNYRLKENIHPSIPTSVLLQSAPQ